MKKIILGALFYYLFFLTQPILADVNQAVSDLRYQLTTYITLHQDYTTAKAKYLKFKSLPSEKEAFEKTKSVLIARNKVLKAYFLLLQETINQTQGIEAEDFNNFSAKIQSNIQFLTEQNKRLEEAQLITQLENLSKELETKIEEFQSISEEAKALISLGVIFTAFQTHQMLQQKIAQAILMQSQPISDKALIERWMGESAQNSQNALAKRNEARELLHQFIIEKTGYTKTRLLNSLKTTLEESSKFLAAAVSAQEQVARKVAP